VRVYKAEQGIEFAMNDAGNASSLVTAKVRVGDIKQYFDGMSVADLIKTTSAIQTVEELLGQEQPDLALVVAILVSTGWNLNDDIFTPEEVWKARQTPLHKPMNDNHEASSILGHIVQTRALDKFGNEIELAEDESPPEEFDIEVAGVLYRAFPELSERIEEIIAKAGSGEMFVSMEAWFPDFGYGLIDPATGSTKLVERNEETAFLTKHLRIYGGSGEYQGYKIGRVLKNIIFGAQGFVETPANPESVIKVAANKNAASSVFVTAELSELPEGGVGNVKEQLKELQAKLDEALAAIASKDEEIAALKQAAEEVAAKDYDGQIASLTESKDQNAQELSDLTAKAEELTSENEALKTQLAEVTDRAEKSEAELVEIRKDASARERLAKLADVKQIEDEDATLAELREMTDETFEMVIKYAGEAKTEEPESEEPKEEAVATESDEEAKTEEKEAEQAEAALGDVVEEEGPEFNAQEDAVETEKDGWKTLAHNLCGQDVNKEGGE